MAKRQQYGIKYPFSIENEDEIYMDTNGSYDENIKSQVLHVIFTPKGQRLRNPDFGTDIIKYIFYPNDAPTEDAIRQEIETQVKKYVPVVNFEDFSIYEDENDEHGKIVIIHYSIMKGNFKEVNSVAVKI